MLVNYNQVPADTDVLITHTPPVGFGDLCSTGVGRRSFSSLSIRYISTLITFNQIHNHSHHSPSDTKSFSSLSIRYIITFITLDQTHNNSLIIIAQRHNHSHLTRFGQGASSYYTAFKSGSNPSTTSMATYMKVILLGEGISSICSAPMLGVQNLGHSFLPSLGQDF